MGNTPGHNSLRLFLYNPATDTVELTNARCDYDQLRGFDLSSHTRVYFRERQHYHDYLCRAHDAALVMAVLHNEGYGVLTHASAMLQILVDEYDNHAIR